LVMLALLTFTPSLQSFPSGPDVLLRTTGFHRT
jgi:hypothetical protein